MAIDPRPWMPADLPADQKDYYAATYPHDPHRAAAEAWEAYAATLEPEAAIVSAGTGDQSVTYREGRARFLQADQRARWHRARTKPYSVETFSLGTPPSRYLEEA